MEGIFMNGLWKKRIPAFLLTLVMIVSLMPAALAEGEEGGDSRQDPAPVCQHQNKDTSTTEATCESDGEETITCRDCHTELSRRTLQRLGHEWGSWGPDPGNSSQHLRTCTRPGCGQTQTGSHSFSQYGNSDPQQHWQICGECGAESTRSNHSLSQNSDTNEHWEECICGYKTGRGQHVDSDGNGACDTCGASVHVHNYSLNWSSDSSGHWHECSCGDKKDQASHGTANASGECPICGYKIHQHSWSAQWTQTNTQHWKECTGTINGVKCGEKTEVGNHVDANGDNTCDTCLAKINHVHVPATTPQKDASGHWYLCTTCGQIATAKAPHTDVSPRDGKCDVCDWQIANTFTVTFNTNGGTSISPQTVVAGGKPTAVSNPSRSGYAFKGWSTSSSAAYTGQTLLSAAQIASTPVNANTTYYAVYTVYRTGATDTVEAASSIGSLLWYRIASKGFTPTTVRFTSLGDSRYGTLYLGTTQSSGYAVSVNNYTPAQVNAMTFRSGSYNGNYILSYTASDSYGNSASGTITIAGTTAANKIEYTVSAGRSKAFSRSDFLDVYRRAVGSGATLYYVSFSAPSDYNDFGAVTSDSKTFTRSNLSDYEFYYSDKRYGQYALDTAAFKADANTRGNVMSLGFTAYGNGGNVTGTVEITIAGSAKGDVTYNVKPGRQQTFDATDFNKAFQKAYGSTRKDITYVVFDAPSSYDSFRGQLQVSRTTFDRKKLNDTSFYYSSSKYGDYSLDRLSFEADSKAKEGDSLSIPFRAYYDTGYNDYENCTLVINIGDGAVGSGDINYDVTPGKTVDFKSKDFNSFFRETYSGATVSYVVFEQPDSSAFSQGTLYHNYNTSSSKSFTRTNVDDFEFYYSPGKNDYGIGNLTFVANNNFTETVTLEFIAYGSGNRSVTGTVSIRSTENVDNGDVNYTVTPGKSVDLQRTAFNNFFRKKYNSTVSYVVFDRPSDTNIFNNGTLYCDYGASSQTSFSRGDLSGTRFYYDKNDMGRNDYYLDELTFVANSNFRDSITLTFTAYGEYDDDYVEGKLVIKADGAAAAVSNYTGSIRYSTTTGVNVQINANDIARYYKSAYPSYTLQYVVLGGVPNAGNLYYNYYNASSYGSASRAQITSANYSGQSFYFSPTSTSQFALSELTYVPSGSGYCASIPFTAYGTSGTSVTGAVLISVSREKVAEVYGVTPKNTAVSFPASQVYSAVLSATSSALSGIQLLSLPPVTAGSLYIGTGTTRADTKTVYTYAAGANQMSQLRFVPATGYTGSVEIPYVALNSNGVALASGSFSLGVVNSRKTLSDVNSSTWCYKYVMELSDQNVISGYSDGSFKPNSTVTYGAALKLIMLAAGYPEQAPTGKNVFSGYLAKAQADGIVTRSNVSLTAPITRLQVAQIAAGALKLNTSNLSSVKPFTDTADVYVQALNAAGIVEGYFSNGTSTYRPSATLTRGQMSAIVWRMNQYRK